MIQVISVLFDDACFEGIATMPSASWRLNTGECSCDTIPLCLGLSYGWQSVISGSGLFSRPWRSETYLASLVRGVAGFNDTMGL